MRFVRDRADAKWLPSRYRFATFRLAAWLRFRAARPAMRPGLVLAIDRDQSAIESYTVAIFFAGSASLFLFAILHPWLSWWAAMPVAVLGAVTGPQALVVLFAFGPSSWRQQNHVELNSFVQMFLVMLAAIDCAGQDGWASLAGRAFLLIIAMNAVASAVVRLLRPRMEAAEREIVGG